MLRRELRTMVPELPLAQYWAPAAAQQQQQQQGQGAGDGGGGGGGKPATLGGRDAVAGALGRLQALRKEGERLAEEGGSMDRCASVKNVGAGQGGGGGQALWQ